jgi:hypothetical protein
MGRLLFLFARVRRRVARAESLRAMRMSAIRRTMRTMHGGCEAQP